MDVAKVINNPEEVKVKIQRALNYAAEDIKENGLDALFSENQYICGGKIIIEIGTNIVPSVTYERNVCIPFIE